jgi:hypothetical protein
MTAAAASTGLVLRPPSALLRSNGLRYDWLGLVNAGNGTRETIMRTAAAPAFESLVGWEWRGANGSVLTRAIGIRKFVKGFYDGPDRSATGPTPHVHGYNIVVRQNADDAPHLYVPSDAAPKRHGYYRVHAPIEGARDAYYPNALLLDYALGGNGPFGPPLRDYVVQVYPDNPDLLLGKAYLALGPIRIPAGFFILERLRRHDHRG